MGVSIRIPPEVQQILLRLQSAGFAAFAVGGCVRDSLLGKQPSDWDICTNARPAQTQACFSRCLLTGAKYGTVTVLEDGTCYEVTTFRTENGYTDSRHPDEITFLDCLQGDLARRDFTVNAMAADAQGTVTDLFGGIADLKNGTIRCVGTARERFSEDALRILRALRFAARFGFSVEPETASAIHELRESLHHVAAERLRKELSGLLLGAHAVEILREFSDVLCVLLPEIQPCIGFLQHNPHHKLDVFEHTLAALSQTPPEEALRLAVLLHDIGKPDCFTRDEKGIGHFYGHAERSAQIAEAALRRLRYDNQTVKLVTTLVREHNIALQPLTDKRLRRLLADLGEDTLRKLLQLRRADALGTMTADKEQLDTELAHIAHRVRAMLEREGCLKLRDLAINGNDLIALGVPQGTQIGQILQQLFDAVLDERCQNERSALVDFAQNILSNAQTD